MFKLKFILTFFILIGLYNNSTAKQKEEDQIIAIQKLISQAYELGYVDAAPLEMSLIEKKVKEAKETKKKRTFNALMEQVKADLKIVKMRYEVNQLNSQLSRLQADNTQSERVLLELRNQLQ